jgi:hypothetical protein
MPSQRRRRSDREPLESSPLSVATPGLSSADPLGLPAIDLNPDEIARRAYELYQQRGGTHGDDWNDWFQAEQQLRRSLVVGV